MELPGQTMLGDGCGQLTAERCTERCAEGSTLDRDDRDDRVKGEGQAACVGVCVCETATD